MEEIMLRARLAEGLPLTLLDRARSAVIRNGWSLTRLIDPSAYAAGRLVLTRQGRLLADAVIRDLT